MRVPGYVVDDAGWAECQSASGMEGWCSHKRPRHGDRADNASRSDCDLTVSCLEAGATARGADGHVCDLQPSGVPHGDDRLSLPVPSVTDAQGSMAAVDDECDAVASAPVPSGTQPGVSYTCSVGSERALSREPDVRSTCS